MRMGDLPSAGLQAGADEVVSDLVSDKEKSLRLELVLRRAARDVNVHPTTRLPGTAQIERDLSERMASGGHFAVCYADLDHFKEFNDRYGYNWGDSVIYLTSRILRDMVRSLAPGGFVGHIGGDDFIFNVPLEYLETCCDEIIRLFDELIPYQYTEEDRKAGYFLGKDRRGTVHRIPLMTLSIGVVTNHTQEFTHTAQVSELAAEMKTYGKSLPGSVYVVDRRGWTENSSATSKKSRPRKRIGKQDLSTDESERLPTTNSPRGIIDMNCECSGCGKSFPVDPNKVPPDGVFARCSNCSQVFFVQVPPDGLETIPLATEAAAPAMEEPPSGWLWRRPRPHRRKRREPRKTWRWSPRRLEVSPGRTSRKRSRKPRRSLKPQRLKQQRLKQQRLKQQRLKRSA